MAEKNQRRTYNERGNKLDRDRDPFCSSFVNYKRLPAVGNASGLVGAGLDTLSSSFIIGCNYVICIEMEITSDFNGMLRAIDRERLIGFFEICRPYRYRCVFYRWSGLSAF